MKIRNAVVGTRVQMKNIDLHPTDCSSRTGRQYGLTEENYGTIIREVDSDHDVGVRFENFNHVDGGYRDTLYVNVEHLRKVK